jgi:hypothetical protein
MEGASMSFGFPAYHTEHVSCQLNPSFRYRLDKAVRSLGWLIWGEMNNTMTASTQLNWLSWGERVNVEYTDQGYTITSRCILFTQCFDWGKNKSNVRKLISKLNEPD